MVSWTIQNTFNILYKNGLLNSHFSISKNPSNIWHPLTSYIHRKVIKVNSVNNSHDHISLQANLFSNDKSTSVNSGLASADNKSQLRVILWRGRKCWPRMRSNAGTGIIIPVLLSQEQYCIHCVALCFRI